MVADDPEPVWRMSNGIPPEPAFPNSLVWSADNLLALALKGTVSIHDADDMSPRGRIRHEDATSAAEAAAEKVAGWAGKRARDGEYDFAWLYSLSAGSSTECARSHSAPHRAKSWS